MKIAAAVILYHPDKHALANIISYCNHVNMLYVFDNSAQASGIEEKLLALGNISYFHDGDNRGIASRLNQAAAYAIRDGFEWLLMMDQDSGFADGMLDEYINCLDQFAAKTEVALFGVNAEKQPIITVKNCYPQNPEDLITSGTLLNLSLFLKIGPFDEQLFIDGVDHEYTIRTLVAGYKTVRFSNITLLHQIGTLVKRTSIKTMFLMKKEKRVHSALRCYYVYRNNLYLQKKYRNTKVVNMGKLNSMAMSVITTALFYGRNSFMLVRFLYKARIDFANNKMGKYASSFIVGMCLSTPAFPV